MPDSISLPALSRPRLKYLDGLRGIAAFYVALNHLYWNVNFRAGFHLPEIVGAWAVFMGYGRLSVAVFIVLSGYSLMIPIARSAEQAMPKGAVDYFKRRANRIIPPYYAALALSLLFIALVPGLRRMGEWQWDFALPAFGPGAIGAHLLLIQDFNPRWIYKINPPLWSVAVEWQIYFFLPFVLLPLWRRFGLLAMLSAGIALGCLPCLLWRKLDLPSSPWFLGLFAMGASAAVVNFSDLPRYTLLRECLRWNWITAGVGVVCVLAWLGSSDKQAFTWLPSEMLAGAFVACLLISCAVVTQGGGTSRFARVCETRPILTLGGMSYSLYLIHQPILTLRVCTEIR